MHNCIILLRKVGCILKLWGNYEFYMLYLVGYSRFTICITIGMIESCKNSHDTLNGPPLLVIILWYWLWYWLARPLHCLHSCNLKLWMLNISCDNPSGSSFGLNHATMTTVYTYEPLWFTVTISLLTIKYIDSKINHESGINSKFAGLKYQ